MDKIHRGDQEKAGKRRIDVLGHSKNEEILSDLGLLLNRQTLALMFFMHESYKKLINVHGMIVEFGTRWGQNLALFSSFSGMCEPYNYNRKVVGFDTFEGYPDTFITENDGGSEIIKKGAYSVIENYEEHLKMILDYCEKESPISHIKKYDLVRGDATVEIKEYLGKNPETVIALAYFDFDRYLHTKKCLEATVRGGTLQKEA